MVEKNFLLPCTCSSSEDIIVLCEYSMGERSQNVAKWDC